MTDLSAADSPAYLFLLGGHDLEMHTIRTLLEAQGLREGLDFHDRQLDWRSALLSAYQDVLPTSRIPVGIELRSDIEEPPGYHLIDHHNQYSDRPAALVQVAELLGLTLTRRQQLVAANDAGYIPAMQAMGASPEEIAAIRQADRRVQGVTEQEEAQAEQELAQLRQMGVVKVLETSLSRFSPLTDRLYGTRHLLIYNHEELTYYGPARDLLAQAYAEAVQAGAAYYGGGKDGFFGLAAGHWSAPEIKHQVEKICSLISE